MKASQWLATRQGRVALLTSMAVGWTGVVIGAASGQRSVLAAGAGVIAVTNLTIAKAVVETRSSMEDLNRARARLEGTAAGLTGGVDRLRDRIKALEAKAASMEPRIGLLGAEIKDQTTALGAESALISREIDEVRTKLNHLESSHQITRAGLVTTRAFADKLAERTGGARVDQDRLRAAATSRIDSALLSIAIPSFNRPGELAELLNSIETEVATCPDGLIEVWITDDASSDPETIETALTFVETHSFASLRVQPSNIGLERNVMASAEPCRGDYLMLVGNDDILLGGALSTIIGDIQETPAPVLLYGKRRIKLDGTPHADVLGSIPINLEAGQTHTFDTLVEAAGEQGFLSTFGFLSTIVVRRVPFQAVDPEPYLGHTLFARACVLLAAFAREQVFYRNRATVAHRTRTQSQKHVEALGRQEEEFMSGGNARLARYFGTSLAAMLQRLIDHGALDHQTIARMPERLMTRMPLVDWIAHNRSIDPAMDGLLDPHIVEDANRFFAALGVATPSAEVG